MARKPRVSDLPSTGYGDTAALERSVAAVPMGEGGPPAPFIGTNEVPNVSDPTDAPGEPLTAGLPTGAGVGPEALGMGPQGQTSAVRQALQAMLLAHPNNDIMRLLDRLDITGR